MRSGSRFRAALGGGLAILPAVVAAAPWPAEPAVLPADWRSPGGGLAILPAVLWWLGVLVWVRTVDWVGRDATKHGIAPAFWSTVCGLPLPLVALLAWWLFQKRDIRVGGERSWKLPTPSLLLRRERKAAQES